MRQLRMEYATRNASKPGFVAAVALVSAVVLNAAMAGAAFADPEAIGWLSRPIAAVPATAPHRSLRELTEGPDYSEGGFCNEYPWLCTDTFKPYVGHDEPSVLFYSAGAGAGNSNLYTLVLPKDPPTKPNQTGTAGTFNFQLHPAFWFGMAMCDPQSAPEFTTTCTPDSDRNIFEGTNPAAPDYIGKHPGGAYMEMQFYPPGWFRSCDASHWCAAITIDSFNQDQNNNISNNTDCQNKVGLEPINAAYITRNGVATTPADPLNNGVSRIDLANDLLMNQGDVLTVQMNDTAAGFQVIIKDLTSGQQGSMTASIANGFRAVNFAPSAATCTSTPFAFHPMFATSSEHTSLTWTTHSYNVAFADEIGHFEYCSSVDPFTGACTGGADGTGAGPDADDTPCGIASPPLVPIGGCIGTDSDFDGVPYQKVWPGTNPNVAVDQSLHPSPIRFSSAKYLNAGAFHNYERVGLEANLPAIESACNVPTGAGCTPVPVGANLYPVYSTTTFGGQCMWQLGGLSIPGTTNRFGEPATSEWGPLTLRVLPEQGGPGQGFLNFRNVMSTNPCPAGASTPTPTPRRTPTPKPTATPKPGPLKITSIPAAVLVGASFPINGTGFTAGSVINFFVATAHGSVNVGPFKTVSHSATLLTVKVPATTPLGQGFVAVQVVNTDQNFAKSNLAYALLQGAATAGLPTLKAINGSGLDATSVDPNFATNNVRTVVPQGSVVKLGGTGFDTANGIAIDLFCACPGGKVGPFFLNHGAPGLTTSLLSFVLPASGVNAPPTGPGSFVISNAGLAKSYTAKSNAVSVPIGARIVVTSVARAGSIIVVKGNGFSSLTVINFFNKQKSAAVNLGGLKPSGAPRIPLKIVDQRTFTFGIPAGAVFGPSYVQALNPPFVPFTSSGNGPGGSFNFGPAATPSPSKTPLRTPTKTPIPTRTPTRTATPRRTPTRTPHPTPTATRIVRTPTPTRAGPTPTPGPAPRLRSGSYALNLGVSPVPGCVESAAQTLAGVAVGDVCTPALSVNLQPGQVLDCFVNAPNQVVFQMCQFNGAGLDPDGGGAIFRAVVSQ